ncbi:MAG: hypothetical protein AAF289_11090, partial [Cyanobacteria bacterium P01_A01_bin.135]
QVVQPLVTNDVGDIFTDGDGNRYLTNPAGIITSATDAAGNLLTGVTGNINALTQDVITQVLDPISGLLNTVTTTVPVSTSNVGDIFTDSGGNRYLTDLAGVITAATDPTGNLLTGATGNVASLTEQVVQPLAVTGIGDIFTDSGGNRYLTDLAGAITAATDAAGNLLTGVTGNVADLTEQVVRSLPTSSAGDIFTDAAGNRYITDLGGRVTAAIDATGSAIAGVTGVVADSGSGVFVLLNAAGSPSTRSVPALVELTALSLSNPGSPPTSPRNPAPAPTPTPGDESDQTPPVPTPRPNQPALVFGEEPRRSAFTGDRANRVNGTAKPNKVRGSRASDAILGRGGNDRMQGRGGDDWLSGGLGNDKLSSGSGNDILKGGAGSDRLLGGRGDDLLFGGTGSDRLKGGKGRDVLVGGAGQDLLIGSDSPDQFVFDKASHGGDTIRRFRSNDLIDIRDIFARTAFTASSAAEQFRRFVSITQVGTGTVIGIDADGNGAGTGFRTLATLDFVDADAISSKNFIVR